MNPVSTFPESATIALSPDVFATLRPVAPDDAPAERSFVANLSAGSRYNRFHAGVNGLTEAMTRYLTCVDQRRHVAFVATIDDAGTETLVGDARYVVAEDGMSAEFAIAIADRWQGCGLAQRLIEALAACARKSGLRWLVGEVLASNIRMLAFAERLGFAQSARGAVDGVVRIERSVDSIPVRCGSEGTFARWTRRAHRWFAPRPFVTQPSYCAPF